MKKDELLIYEMKVATPSLFNMADRIFGAQVTNELPIYYLISGTGAAMDGSECCTLVTTNLSGFGIICSSF